MLDAPPAPTAASPGLLPAYVRAILDLEPFETLVMTPDGQLLERRLKLPRSEVALARALAGYDLSQYRVTVSRYSAHESILIALVPLSSPAPNDPIATLGRRTKIR